MYIFFCVFIKKLGQVFKNHTMIVISLYWPTKVYFCGDTWKSVQFFCSIKFFDQHKWCKLFPTNIDHNVLNQIGMVRAFFGFPKPDCYQNHGFLSSTHALITQSNSWIHGAGKRLRMIVLPCFELAFRSSIVNKAAIECCRCSFVY